MKTLGVGSGHLIRVTFQLGLDIGCKGWVEYRKEAGLYSSGPGSQCSGGKSDDSRRQKTCSSLHHASSCTLGQSRRIPRNTRQKSQRRSFSTARRTPSGENGGRGLRLAVLRGSPGDLHSRFCIRPNDRRLPSSYSILWNGFLCLRWAPRRSKGAIWRT